jgi:hypothetical protein
MHITFAAATELNVNAKYALNMNANIKHSVVNDIHINKKFNTELYNDIIIIVSAIFSVANILVTTQAMIAKANDKL